MTAPSTRPRGALRGFSLVAGVIVLAGLLFFLMTRDFMVLLMALVAGGILAGIGALVRSAGGPAAPVGASAACATCGQGNPGGARFCNACGRSL